MSISSRLLILISLLVCNLAGARETLIQFDQMKPGTTPSGWKQGFYGEKGAPSWKVAPDSTAPSAPFVLKQTGNAVYGYFVFEGKSLKDGSVGTQFNILSGTEDPEAGVVFRFVDGKNYLYVRANILENNLIFYRMRAGKKELVRSVDVKVSRAAWHELKVSFKGPDLRVFFDGKEAMTLKDLKNLKAGLAGLFTTADTVSAFDDVRIND